MPLFFSYFFRPWAPEGFGLFDIVIFISEQVTDVCGSAPARGKIDHALNRGEQ